jgi:hypothetical protein
VHRHGDRTPITRLTNESYWLSQLPVDADGIPLGPDGTTELDRCDDAGKAAEASGIGEVSGQLTAKGRGQLQALGSVLKRRLTDESYSGRVGLLPARLAVDTLPSVEGSPTRPP